MQPQTTLNSSNFVQAFTELNLMTEEFESQLRLFKYDAEEWLIWKTFMNAFTITKELKNALLFVWKKLEMAKTDHVTSAKEEKIFNKLILVKTILNLQ